MTAKVFKEDEAISAYMDDIVVQSKFNKIISKTSVGLSATSVARDSN